MQLAALLLCASNSFHYMTASVRLRPNLPQPLAHILSFVFVSRGLCLFVWFVGWLFVCVCVFVWLVDWFFNLTYFTSLGNLTSLSTAPTSAFSNGEHHAANGCHLPRIGGPRCEDNP
jgi:hypothetical protein